MRAGTAARSKKELKPFVLCSFYSPLMLAKYLSLSWKRVASCAAGEPRRAVLIGCAGNCAGIFAFLALAILCISVLLCTVRSTGFLSFRWISSWPLFHTPSRCGMDGERGVKVVYTCTQPKTQSNPGNNNRLLRRVV